MDIFKELPIELSYKIFDIFEPQTLATLLRVNKEWFYLVKGFINDYNLLKDVTRYDVILFRTFAERFYNIKKSLNLNMDNEILYDIIGHGCSVAMLAELVNKWIRRPRTNTRLSASVALNGNLDQMKLLAQYDFPLTIKEERNEVGILSVFDCAAKHGNIDNMKWLLENGCVFSANTFGEAAKNGNLDNMKWLFENGCPWTIIHGYTSDVTVFNKAVENGNLDNMKWLLEKGCPFRSGFGSTFNAAVKTENLKNMKWLLENGCHFNNDTFRTAAETGNLDNMKWLLEIGCPFGDYTLNAAVKHGNLDNMKWLIENGCPLPRSFPFSEAVINGSIKVMEWLLEILNVSDIIDELEFRDGSLYSDAAACGNIDMMNWLLGKGVPMDEWAFHGAARSGNADVVKWLIDNKCPKNFKLIYRILNTSNWPHDLTWDDELWFLKTFILLNNSS